MKVQKEVEINGQHHTVLVEYDVEYPGHVTVKSVLNGKSEVLNSLDEIQVSSLIQSIKKDLFNEIVDDFQSNLANYGRVV